MLDEDANTCGCFLTCGFSEPTDAGRGVQPDVRPARPSLGNSGRGEESAGGPQLAAPGPDASRLVGHEHEQHPQVGGT